MWIHNMMHVKLNIVCGFIYLVSKNESLWVYEFLPILMIFLSETSSLD